MIINNQHNDKPTHIFNIVTTPVGLLRLKILLKIPKAPTWADIRQSARHDQKLLSKFRLQRKKNPAVGQATIGFHY